MKRAVALIVAVRLLASPNSAAQSGARSDGGTITGIVSDLAKGVLPGAVITVIAGDVPRRVTAAADGRYRVAGLPPGVYRVRAELAGFRPSPVETVTVAGGGTVELPLRCASASCSPTTFCPHETLARPYKRRTSSCISGPLKR